MEIADGGGKTRYQDQCFVHIINFKVLYYYYIFYKHAFVATSTHCHNEVEQQIYDVLTITNVTKQEMKTTKKYNR